MDGGVAIFVDIWRYPVVDVGDSSITGASESDDDDDGEAGIASSALSSRDAVRRMLLLVQPIVCKNSRLAWARCEDNETEACTAAHWNMSDKLERKNARVSERMSHSNSTPAEP
ncbi:hypothetical protein PRNP1_005871 [Phytophthora ramorum]